MQNDISDLNRSELGAAQIFAFRYWRVLRKNREAFMSFIVWRSISKMTPIDPVYWCLLLVFSLVFMYLLKFVICLNVYNTISMASVLKLHHHSTVWHVTFCLTYAHSLYAFLSFSPLFTLHLPLFSAFIIFKKNLGCSLPYAEDRI